MGWSEDVCSVDACGPNGLRGFYVPSRKQIAQSTDNGTGKGCKLGQAALGRRIRVSERQARRLLLSLEKRKAITRRKRWDGSDVIDLAPTG